MGGGSSRLPFVSTPSLFGRRGTRQERSPYDCNQHFPRSADRAIHDPAVPLDAQAETAVGWVSITKDVPILRIDHVSFKGKLLGVWQALYSSRVLDFKEMNRPFVHVFQERSTAQ